MVLRELATAKVARIPVTLVPVAFLIATLLPVNLKLVALLSVNLAHVTSVPVIGILISSLDIS